MIRLLLLLAVLGVAAAPAWGATRYEIIDDCADDGRLRGDYTLAELRDARRHMRTEVAEYTDCADVLRSAELRLMQGAKDDAGGGAPEGASSERPAAVVPLVPSGDAEQGALRRARAAGAAPVEVTEGRTVVPGSAGFSPASVRNEMPASLLVLLVAMGLLGGGAYAARRTGSHRGTTPGGRLP